MKELVLCGLSLAGLVWLGCVAGAGVVCVTLAGAAVVGFISCRKANK